MLKVARSGRRRSNSFSLLDKGDSMPMTPHPTPSSSFIPNSMLENKVLALHIDDQEQLLKAAEDMILKPSDIEVEDEDEKERLRQLREMCKGFTMSDEQLQHIEKRMIMEINWGLGKDTNHTSNIKSYITYVSQLPTGRESGAYLALDLGGTNFRVILMELDTGTTSVRMKAVKHAVSEDLMTGPGEDLFNFMADKLKEFMVEHQLMGERYNLGFTFSFPTIQHSLASADLATWTKGFVCAGVEGEDVVKLLEKAIKRHPEINVNICAILNDTTGCLIACAYKRPDCAIGVIIGTGTNASYVEDIRNVELYQGHAGKKKEVVINTEWGGLGNTGSLDFIRTRFDHAVDKNSKNVTKQVYEKLISGMYLGELTRQVILEAAQKQILFKGQNVEMLKRKEIFQTRHISEIESDEVGDYSSTWAVLAELGLSSVATQFDCQLLRFICESISIRAALLAAAGVAALLNKMGRRTVTVGMDGSLYKFHPHFQARMTAKIRHLVDKAIQFNLVLSEDGSGRGAGLAAAVTAK
eukprot:TRINITY_DN9760_c0_g1_i2.p1 TRINITY_DN9760_c0_g1~~TRINITY_DN9760_c0_g1_i2.p1  ORF type:complete len:526 (+),score=148.61 TRINITY_DN9760_c0_g1_i2:48-1625(+)